MNNTNAFLYGNLINSKFHENGAWDHVIYSVDNPSSLFVPCPYCITKDPCHFCDEVDINSRYCLVEAGVHCCTTHGKLYLSKSHNNSSLHTLNSNSDYPIKTKDGRTLINIRKMLYLKEQISDFGDKQFKHHPSPLKANIKDSINLTTQLSKGRKKLENKTKSVPIKFNTIITSNDNEW